MSTRKMSESMRRAIVLNKNESDELRKKVRYLTKSRDEALMELRAERLRLAIKRINDEREEAERNIDTSQMKRQLVFPEERKKQKNPTSLSLPRLCLPPEKSHLLSLSEPSSPTTKQPSSFCEKTGSKTTRNGKSALIRMKSRSLDEPSGCRVNENADEACRAECSVERYGHIQKGSSYLRQRKGSVFDFIDTSTVERLSKRPGSNLHRRYSTSTSALQVIAKNSKETLPSLEKNAFDKNYSRKIRKNKLLRSVSVDSD